MLFRSQLDNNSTVCTDHIVFIHSSFDGHLGCSSALFKEKCFWMIPFESRESKEEQWSAPSGWDLTGVTEAGRRQEDRGSGLGGSRTKGFGFRMQEEKGVVASGESGFCTETKDALGRLSEG